MANVTFIPAKRQVGNNIKKAEKPKLRVAAYCRVSTDSDEQATSYDAQIEHYTEYISKNPEWVLAGIFADDGITGTNTKKRDEFNRMIDECHAGNIDRNAVCRRDARTRGRRFYRGTGRDRSFHNGSQPTDFLMRTEYENQRKRNSGQSEPFRRGNDCPDSERGRSFSVTIGTE